MIDIVIVNWNSGHYLADCIKSIAAFKRDAAIKVVIVDNGSTDHSLEFDAEDVPLEIIRAGRNLGFAGACNLGAAQGLAPYILFLNPDTRLMEGTLSKSTHFMEGDAASRTGICGVRLVDENGDTHRDCARIPSARDFIARSLGLDAIFPNLFPAVFLRNFDHESSRKVDHVMGAYFLVRRALFETLHGFDERFFVYLEDLDFSARTKQVGWETWYLAEAAIFHKGGGTSEKIKVVRLFYSISSRLRYARKHFTLAGTVAVFISTLCVEPLARLARALIRGSPQEAIDTMRAYGLIWKDALLLLSNAKAAKLPVRAL